jgi:hypothetical protein
MAFMDTLQSIGTGAKNLLVGSPGHTELSPKLNPQQQQLQSLAGTQASSLLQNLGQNKFNFAPIAQQARTNFQTKTIPSIANRFAGLGAQGSGAYQHALGSAGAGLEEGLAALQAKYDFAQGGQDQQLLLALLSQALQPQQDNIYYPAQGGLAQQLLPFLTGGASTGISSLLKLIGLG